MKKRTVVIIAILIVIILIGSFLGFKAYKKNELKDEVLEHLLETGVKENEILILEPTTTNLPGDKHYFVEVKLKEDEKLYFYYKDSNSDEILLESYRLNGEEILVN